jgi:hypothetical protein
MMETETKTRAKDLPAGSASVRASREWPARLLVALLGLVASVIAAVPFFFMGDVPPARSFELRMPVTHDMHLHLEQMKSFYTGLEAGEVYPRWEEDTNRGFGAPTTSYYPPAIYYLTSSMYRITRDWIQALLGANLLMTLAAAAAIYIYARQVMGRAAAATAMVAYLFLPYRVVDQYQRGALAEMLGFIWMPLILLFAERMFNDRKQSTIRSQVLLNTAGLALSLSAFLWSHPPTAYQFLMGFAVFVCILAFMRKDARGLLTVGGATLLGVALSAAYLYPAFAEQDFIRREYVSDTWPYHSTYVFVHDLPFSGQHRGFFNLIDSIWIFYAVAIAAGAIVLIALRPKSLESCEGLKQRALLWVIMGALATFMMTRASEPIGRLIPKIDIGVFTWRMLSISTLVVALVAGTFVQAAANAVRLKRRREVTSFALLALLLTLGGAAFTVASVWGPMFRAPVFAPASEHINYAMIPKNAPEDPNEYPLVRQAELAANNGQVQVERWDPEHRSIRVLLDRPDRLLIRTFNFPGWSATVDGESVTITNGRALRVEMGERERLLIRDLGPDSEKEVAEQARTHVGGEELGDIVIDLSEGAHQVRLDYLDTPARRTGRIISMVSGFLTLAVIGLSAWLRWHV